ncbi:hypothetical protein [Bradyrhizobium sp. ORS 86]|uniref:hypothetical protein n=1 Tax=Bradyrhizobium sp. ORS 86 TaxID=1685970 RepID=UPI00388E71D4
MAKKHHNAGPTFSPGSMKKPRPIVPDPEKKRVELDQAARDADKQRRFWVLLNKDPRAWFAEYFGKRG